MNGKDVKEISFNGQGFLVMGNESEGIRKDVEPFVTQKISIAKSSSSNAESLNVSIATAILCHSLTKWCLLINLTNLHPLPILVESQNGIWMEIKTTFEYLKVLDSIAEIIDTRPITPEMRKKLKDLMVAVRDFEKHALKVESAQKRLINNFLSERFLLN